MKKHYFFLFLGLLAFANVNAQTLYSNTTQTSGRFNAGVGASGTPIITFDDINIFSSAINDADSIGFTKIKVGIRQIAGAPAVTVKVYLTGLDPASFGFDSLPVVPPILIGTFAVPANTSATLGRTQILSVGDSINVFRALARDTGNLVTGFQTAFIGVSFSAVDANASNGWRVTSDGGNIDAGWNYDVDDVVAPRTAFSLTSATATFYAEAFGRPVYVPVANDARVSDITPPEKVSCFNSAQTVTVQIQNLGENTIAPGAAAVTLKVGGANTYSRTINNTTSIIKNGTETVTFSDVSLNNAGDNFDTAIVRITGDARHTNDTLTSGSITASVITAFPAAEDVEGIDLPLVSYAATVAGGQLWRIHSQDTAYKNPDMADSLHAHSGTSFFVFDSYRNPNSDGVISRLFTNCVTLTRSIDEASSTVSFFMSHDTAFTTAGAPDSLYISVSTDKGNTWTRLAGFARLNPLFATPGWKKETVDLSAYGCQTIQIGFEGASHWGNIIGLDDIVVSSTGDLNCVVSTDFNWTGNVSTAWETPGNWGGNAVPTATSNVTIPAGRPRYPIVNTTTTVKSVTCAPGTAVTVVTGVILNILK